MPLAAGTVARATYRSVCCPPWRRVLPGMLFGHRTWNIMKPQGIVFSTPVGEDVERRQGGGMFPDYSWVPVGALRKTRLISAGFPKIGKTFWNRAKNDHM